MSTPNAEIGEVESLCQVAGVAPKRMRDMLRQGEQLGGSPAAAVEWLRDERDRLQRRFTDPDVSVTKAEFLVLIILAAHADDHGVTVIERRKLAALSGLDGKAVQRAFEWGRWRDSLSAHRVSEAGSSRIERVTLHHWAHRHAVNARRTHENGPRIAEHPLSAPSGRLG